MKALGWVCVVLGFIITVGTILAVREDNSAYSALCSGGNLQACAQTSSPAIGLIIGAVVAGFGLLLVAIRGAGGSAESPSVAATTVTETPLMKKCPECAEEIRAEALICRFCRHRSDSEPAS
jgi:hypothetical protein